jgi:hypothetical protein
MRIASAPGKLQPNSPRSQRHSPVRNKSAAGAIIALKPTRGRLRNPRQKDDASALEGKIHRVLR